MTFRSGLVLILLLALQSCSSAHPFLDQPDAIATVIESHGIPTLNRRALPYVLGNQSQLYQGDIVRTDNTSILTIELITGSRFTLSPRSELHIEEVSSNGSDWILRFNLASGAMEIAHSNKPETFVIRTNIASVMGKNANLWVGYSAGYRRLDVVSLGQTDIVVSNQDGAVTLSVPMEASTILPGAAPQQKTQWSSAKLQATRQTFNRIH